MQTDIANNGQPYAKPGIEAPEGATVRLHAEKGSVVRDVTITVPKTKAGGEKGDTGESIKPALPATVSGKALLQWQVDTSSKIDPTQVTQ